MRALLFTSIMLFFSCQPKEKVTTTTKIISIGGTTSETLAALGLEEAIVAVDITSIFPKTLTTKTNLGHVSQLKTETLLSIEGVTHIVAQEGLIPVAVLERLRTNSINVIIEPLTYSIEGAKQFITAMGEHFDKKDQAAYLIDTMKKDLNKIPKIPTNTTLLFAYGRGSGAISGAGKETVQDALMKIIGVENACKNFSGFQLLSPEALVAANPSHFLLFDHTYQILGAQAGLMQIPGVAATTAGKTSQFIVLESSLIGNFGPRIGQAAFSLAEALNSKK